MFNIFFPENRDVY